MEYTNLNIRTPKDVKAKAEKIFDELGISTTTAFNIFLKQVIRTNGIPFELVLEKPNALTLEAMEEAERVARDPDVKGYSDIDELMSALETE